MCSIAIVDKLKTDFGPGRLRAVNQFYESAAQHFTFERTVLVALKAGPEAAVKTIGDTF